MCSEVKSAIWDEESALWKVQVLQGTQIVEDWCHVFVNGSGVLKYASLSQAVELVVWLIEPKPLVIPSNPRDR